MHLNAGPVILRPLRSDDYEPLIQILSDSETMKWALEDRPFTGPEAKRFIATNFSNRDDPFGMHVISMDLDQPAIGFAALRECTLLGERDVEFGWVLAKEHHGRGYATALGRTLIDYALNTLQLSRVIAACNPANTVSEHILHDKLGMRFDREVEPRPNYRRRVYIASRQTVLHSSDH